MASDLRRPVTADLPLFRFGLRQLFGFVTLFCAVLAAMAVAGGVAAAVVLMAALVVAAHILGTALGSRLREHADRRIDADGSEAPNCQPSPVVVHGPRPLWHIRGRSTLGRLPTIVLGGILLGLFGGGTFLAIAIGDHTSIAGVIVGAISLAVVGGWMAFLGCSFYTMLRQGVREAVANSHDATRR